MVSIPFFLVVKILWAKYMIFSLSPFGELPESASVSERFSKSSNVMMPLFLLSSQFRMCFVCPPCVTVLFALAFECLLWTLEYFSSVWILHLGCGVCWVTSSLVPQY